MPRSVFPRLSPRGFMERAHANRLMVAHERALEHHLNRVIEAAGRSAAKHYAVHGEAAALKAIEAAAPSISRVLAPSIRMTAREFGQRVVSVSSPTGRGSKSGHHETKAFEDLDAEIEAFIVRHAGERVVQISDALRTQINRIILNGIDEKQSAEQVAEAIVQATSGEMSVGRARRIARTETHTAANAGQLAAARSSPIKFRKRWLSTEDQRTREAHAEANDQVRDLDEPFIVGGEKLMMPGDPRASPGNTINCRCTMLLEPVPFTEQQPEHEFEDIAPLPSGDEPVDPEADLTPGDLMRDKELWAAFFRELRAQEGIPADVTIYAVGPDCGLPQFASAEDIEIGQAIGVPRTASISPLMVNLGAGLQDSFPLYGRPVVVKIFVPKGTPSETGAMAAMEVQLRADTRIVVTGVTEERWGDVQIDADVPIDIKPPRRAYRRMPPKRGVTIVEAEVVE